MGSNIPYALHRKACGEQSEDFRAAQQYENQVLVQVVKEVQTDFFDNLNCPGGSSSGALTVLGI